MLPNCFKKFFKKSIFYTSESNLTPLADRGKWGGGGSVILLMKQKLLFPLLPLSPEETEIEAEEEGEGKMSGGGGGREWEREWNGKRG